MKLNLKMRQHYLFASRFVDAYDLAGAEVKVKKSIPKFVGMGYHTTLALSIGICTGKIVRT